MMEFRKSMLCAARSADLAFRNLTFITQHKVKISIGIENYPEPTRIHPDLGGKYEVWCVPEKMTPHMHFSVICEFNAEAMTYKRAVKMIGMLFSPSGLEAAFKPMYMSIRVRRGLASTPEVELPKNTYVDYTKSAYDVYRYGHVFKNFIQELAPEDTFCDFCTQTKELRSFQEETLLTFCGNQMNSAKGPEKHKLRFKFDNDAETVDKLLLMTSYVFDPGQINGCYWLSGSQFSQPSQNFEQMTRDELLNILQRFYKQEPHIANIYKAKSFHGFIDHYVFFNSPLMINGLEYGVFLMLDGAFETNEKIRVAKNSLMEKISASSK